MNFGDYNESTQPTSPKPIARELGGIRLELERLRGNVWVLTIMMLIVIVLLVLLLTH